MDNVYQQLKEIFVSKIVSKLCFLHMQVKSTTIQTPEFDKS